MESIKKEILKNTVPVSIVPKTALLEALLYLPSCIYPRDDWAPAEEAKHFLKALNHLQEKMKEGKIDYFFDSNSNLLRNITPVKLQNMVNFLKKAIKQLEASQDTPDCKTVWMKYFKD